MKRSLLPMFFLLLISASASWAQDSKENSDFKLAVNLYNDKLFDLALEQFRQFINLYPNTQQGMEARFSLAMAQSKLGRHGEARVTFQNFALSYPDHPRAPEAWMNVADEYVAMKNDGEAALAFERVKTFHPKSKFAPTALLRSAELYEKIRDRDNARRVLRTLTQEYTTPDVLTARLRYAAMLIEDREFESARLESRRVADGTKDAPLRSNALLVSARALVGLGRTDEAARTLNDIIREYPLSQSAFSARLILGELQQAEGNVESAVSSWTNVVNDSANALRQTRQDAFIALGDQSERLGELNSAETFFARAANLKGTRIAEAWYRAGCAAERRGTLIAAAAHYRKAVLDTAMLFDPRLLLAAAFKSARWQNDVPEALAIADRFAREYPGDEAAPQFLLEAATVALDVAGDAQAASIMSQRVMTSYAVSTFADDASLLQARALRSMGNRREALLILDHFEQRFPASERLNEAKKTATEIRTYERSDDRAGVQKLALLLGDVIAQRERGLLAFRLAEIYFYDLNEYRLAADQYAAAIAQELDAATRGTALMGRARALANEFSRPNMGEGRPSHQEVVAAFDSVLAASGSLSSAARSEVALFQLRNAAADSAFGRLVDGLLVSTAPMVDAAEVFLEAGDLAVQRSQRDRGRRAYRKAYDVSAMPADRARARYHLGVTFADSAPDSTALMMELVLRDAPPASTVAQAKILLASLSSTTGNADRALPLISEIRSTMPYAVSSRTSDEMRAMALKNARRFSEAVPQYRNALASLRSQVASFAGKKSISDLLYGLAACADSAGDMQTAKGSFLEYLTYERSSVQSAKAYYALAGIARTENDIIRAERLLRDANAVATRAGMAVGDLALETADLFFRNEKYGDAIALYAELFEKSSLDSVRRLSQARITLCHFRTDNVSEADRRAAAFLRSYPNSVNEAAEFEFERGRYFVRQNQLDRARQRLRNVAKQYPTAVVVPEALYWLGRTFELDQNFPAAVALYDSLLRVFPNTRMTPRISLALGNVYYTLEQWEKASLQFRAILENESRAPDLVPFAMNNLIMTYKEMSMFDAAMEYSRKYIERFPNDPELINKRIDIGVLYQKLGYHDQSILHLQSLLESATPELEAELRYYIGEAYYAKAEYQQAILEFLKVPYLVTRRGKVDWISTSYYMSGQSYEKMGKFDEALTMYQQIVDRKDTDTQFKTAAQKEIDRVKRVAK